MRAYFSNRPQSSLFLIVSYALWAAVSLRWILVFINAGLPQLWLISAILLVYGLLLGLEPQLTRGSTLRAHLYLAVQTSLVLVASFFPPESSTGSRSG